MKKIFLALISLFILSACQNELYKDASEDFKSKQGVYIANKKVLQNFVEENQVVLLKELEISLTRKEDKVVKVSLEAGSQEQLDVWNQKNGTSYVLLPKEMYELDSYVTFDPLFTSMVVPLKLKDVKFSPKGTYALPVRITNGDVAIIGGQTETFVIIEQRLRTKSLRFNGAGSEDAAMFPNDFKVSQWTIEIMLNRSKYDSNNRAICGTKVVSGSSPLDEIFTRFGDVTIAKNQLQIKTGGSQIDVPADNLSAAPNTWYMLSFVYDGKYTSVYINGILAVKREIRTGAYGMTGFWLSGWNELIREVRCYKSARTAQQIASNVWKMVDPDDENLLFYYPMNGKKYDRNTGEIVENEEKIWDWSKNEKHLRMPSKALFDNNEGSGFTFPPLG